MEAFEEADANVELLDVVAVLCRRALEGHAPGYSDTFALSIGVLASTSQSRYGITSLFLTAALSFEHPFASDWATVWCESVDSRLCTVSGQGVLRFLPGQVTSNSIRSQ